MTETLSTTALRANQRKRLWFALGVTALTFLMMCMFIYGTLFTSDEEEIFNKGQAIAQGQLLYTDIGSQHMPLMYYFAALFSLMGIGTAFQFRLCFYFLLAAFWGLISYRYSPRFGRGVTVVTPVLLIGMLPLFQHATCILSEQMQVIGMVILGFELLQFRTKSPLTVGSCVMISLAVFLSFGSAFVSIFAVFGAFVAVALMELRACVKEKRGFIGSVVHLFKRYWKLVLIVAAPFVLLLAYYAIVGSLGDFYGWAYVINRVIYPKYLGGYGSSILGSLVSGVNRLLVPFTSLSFNYSTFIQLGLLVLAAVGLGYVYSKTKSPLRVLGLVIFLITVASRDCFSFHGIPAMATLALFASFAVVQAIRKLRRDASAQYVQRALCAFGAVLMMAPYLNTAVNTLNMPFSLHVPGEVSHISNAVDTLTEDGEGVGFSLLNYEMLISSHTVPASVTGGSCPWLWEYASGQAMQELQEAPPRVFLFTKGLTTWDHKITDYAADLVAFIDENYVSLSEKGYAMMWVRKDYYEQACVLLGLEP